jgi:hypothetical protein
MRVRKRWQWVTHVIAPVVLILGVAVQRYNVHVHHQSPWAGGGFGMFSTVDVPGARATRAYVLTNQGSALIIEPDMGVSRRLVYTRPSAEKLTEAARYLAAQDWRVYEALTYQEIWPSLPDFLQKYLRRSPEWLAALSDSLDQKPGALYPSQVAFSYRRAPSAGTPISAEVHGVRVEVWKPVFDTAVRRLMWRKVEEGMASISP